MLFEESRCELVRCEAIPVSSCSRPFHVVRIGEAETLDVAATHTTMCIEYNSMAEAQQAPIFKIDIRMSNSLMLRECVFKNFSGEDFLESKFLARRAYTEHPPVLPAPVVDCDKSHPHNLEPNGNIYAS